MSQSKPFTRIERALQALNKLTDDQIEQLDKQQNLADLRLKHLQKLKANAITNNHQPKRYQFQSQMLMQAEQTRNANAVSNSQLKNKNDRWNIFAQNPIIVSRQNQKNYEKDFMSRMDQFRSNVRKQLKAEAEIKNLQDKNKMAGPQKKQQNKQASIFSAVFNNQSGIFGSLSQSQSHSQSQKIKNTQFNPFSVHNNTDQSQPKEFFNFNSSNKNANTNTNDKKFVNEQNKESLFPKISSNHNQTNKPLFSTDNKFKQSIHQGSSQNQFSFDNTNKQNQSKTTGFVPGLFQQTAQSSSIFSKKLEEPSMMPPQPINTKSGLFSESNPLAHIQVENKNIFMNNLASLNNEEPKNTKIQPTITPKINIFQNNTNQQPKKQQAASGLLSKSNPYSQTTTGKQKINIFSQNNTQIQNKPMQKQKKQNETVSDKNSTTITNVTNNNIFSSNNIFSNIKPSNTSLFNNIPANVNQESDSSSLFKNPNINTAMPSPSLFTTTPSSNPFSKKEEYQSGSLFTNNLKANTDDKKNQVKAEIKPQTNTNPLNQKQSDKINIFSNNASSQPTTGLFSQINKQQKPQTSLFSNLSTTSNTNSKPQANIFMNNLFSNHQQSTKQPFSSSQSNSNTNSVQQLQKKQTQKVVVNEQSQKSSSVKKNPKQLIGDFVKSKPGDMFSKDSNTNTNNGIFGKSSSSSLFGVPTSSGNIFINSSNSQPASGGIFGNLSSGNIFANTSNNASLFGAGTSTNKNEDDDKDQDEEGAGQDQQILQDKDEADPSKSTGNYNYQKPVVKYRQTVAKFKKGQQNIVQNVIVSIQKYSNSSNHLICVRFPNKCQYFVGTIMPGFTQAAKIRDKQYRNILVNKIIFTDDSGKTIPQRLKIQFKQQHHGHAFLNKFEQVAKK